MSPYLRPLFDALYDMLESDKVTHTCESGPDRGRAARVHAWPHAERRFVILDEAQNTSREQMRMFLTRLGFGSRKVVTGDVTQIDLPREQASGLIQVEGILGSIDGIAFIRFGNEDVVRHRLVQRIVEAYRLHAEETGTQRRR